MITSSFLQLSFINQTALTSWRIYLLKRLKHKRRNVGKKRVIIINIIVCLFFMVHWIQSFFIISHNNKKNPILTLKSRHESDRKKKKWWWRLNMNIGLFLDVKEKELNLMIIACNIYKHALSRSSGIEWKEIFIWTKCLNTLN